jgi:hypothetical protein
MAVTRKSPKPIMRGEELERRISDLVDHVQQASNAFESEDRKDRATPDFSEFLERDLRQYFEDEVIPAIPSRDGGNLIDETELRHEVTKKALVGLKLSALRQAARDLGAAAPANARSEDLAESVARALGWDADAVAQFILDHEEEPTEGHAHVSRLFGLTPEFPSAVDVESTILSYMGRYIRVGLARWYVFVDSAHTDYGVQLFGKYMSYTTDVEQAEDRVGLRPVSRIDDVAAHLMPERGVVEVGDSSARAARAAVFAATAVLGHRPLDYVPHAATAVDPVLGQVHGTSLFLLSILQNRIPASGVERLNLTVARFKLDSSAPSDDDKPTLKAVRFEGSHLLDSSQACRLIVDGRPLANIAFRLTLKRSVSADSTAKPTSSFPVKIAIEPDHVHVTTGLGDDPLESRRVHEIVKDAVWSEMANGHQEWELYKLVQRMTERAESDEPSTAPSVLSQGGE